MLKIKQALISVYNKEGVVELAKTLAESGIEIFATGGTADELRKAGIRVRWTSELTGFPEILGGKVKTLHPDIFAKILATEEEAEKLGIERFQLIVVNLYPPDKEPDIGGVSLIRAGIKAQDRTLVLVSPEDYNLLRLILKNTGGIPDDILRELNKKAALYVVKYQLENYKEYFGYDVLPYVFEKFGELKYGTNPQRKAYVLVNYGYPPDFEILKNNLSLNNLYDADSAIRCALSCGRTFPNKVCACIVKHGSPCGVALADEPKEAISKAWDSDPKSAYGGILSISSFFPEYAADVLKDKFLEVIVAPSFDDLALQKLYKKRTRIIRSGENFTKKIIEIKSSMGAFTYEEYSEDDEDIKEEDMKATWDFDFLEEEIKELLFAYQVVRFAKSNGIVISTNFQTIGIAGGFTSRIDAMEFAIKKAKEFILAKNNAPQKIFVASDGFFPFPDSVELLRENFKEQDIFVAQPGGSIRDKEVIEKAKNLNIKMFITGKRCFRH
jgi:phosphoribosylaminoimidazolecarboxamide formyltransferase/IMP cyclohydrolase